MFFLLTILWLIVESKYTLFWIYLWQLKDYHVGRFLDHFRTEKGKKLFLNPLLAVKIFLILLFWLWSSLFSVWFSALFIIYLAESALSFYRIVSNSLKRPQPTAKTLFLTSLSLIILLAFAIFASFTPRDSEAPVYLLIFDIFSFAIISAIVLIFQPFFVFLRNRVLENARRKMSQMLSSGKLTVVGITGSYGKTSTKEFLSTILAKKFKVLKTKEHQNSEIGIARCILNDITGEHEIFIVEMGSYAKGGIKLLCDITNPKIGIVTGVNEQHLALFGSRENLLSAEGGRELAGALINNGLLILNGDNKYCLDLYKRTGNSVIKKIYTTKKSEINSDARAEEIIVEKDSVSFVGVDNNGQMAHFKANVLGRQNVENLLAAILTGKELGMAFQEISEAFADIKPEQAGMTLKRGLHGINVIDSSYSSNPDGVLADLGYLNVFEQKKAVVMPCLIELGPKSKEVHRNIGKRIGQICDLAIVTTIDRFEDIKAGAVESGMPEKNIVFCEKPDDILTLLTLSCANNDTVLLEGRVPGKLIKLLLE